MTEKTTVIAKESSTSDPIWFHNGKNILVGTLAGITATIIGHPFDTLKVRLQVQSPTNPVYSNVVDCLKKTIEWEGVGGLYKGVGSPLAGQVFMRTALFTSYYETLEYFKNRSQRKISQLKLHEYLCGGIVCGAASAFVDTPLDVFKSKLQIQIMHQKLGQHIEYEYKNVFDCARYIVTKYGMGAAFQGLTATIIRNSCGYSSYFFTFEYMKRLLKSPDESIEKLQAYKLLISGGLAGIVFWTLVYNVDVIKSAMMADASCRNKRAYKNTLDCGVKLYTNEGGYRRLWRGFTPCLLRSVPVNATMLFVVEYTRTLLPSYQDMFG